MNRRLTVVLLFIATQLVAQQEFVISAHRGNSSEAPENTLIANQLAIDAQADFLECDVRRTKDGVMVTLHDTSLNRTTNTRGDLRSFNYSQLANVDAGYTRKFGNKYRGEKIPTLREVLNQAKGKIKVEVEIKESGLADDVVRLVRELNMENDVIIIAFNFSELRRVKQISNIPIKYLVSFFWGSRNLRQLQSIGGEYFGPPGVVSTSRINEANRMGIKIISYTIDSERDIRRAIANGQYGIATNYPRRAVEIKENTIDRVKQKQSEILLINESEILVYPNPVKDYFKIKTVLKEAQVRLIDELGFELINFGLIKDLRSYEFNVPQISGKYWLEVKYNTTKEIIPIILD